MRDMLLLLWPRNGAPMLSVRFVAVAVASKKWCPNAKKYDWLPQDVRFVPAALASKCCPNANMCNLFALLWPPSK